MPATAVVTLRMNPELLAALEERAMRDGRSVSAEVIGMLRKEIDALPGKSPTRRTTMGMFPDFEAPDSAELKKLRRKFFA